LNLFLVHFPSFLHPQTFKKRVITGGGQTIKGRKDGTKVGKMEKGRMEAPSVVLVGD
jgi:starvation-inducible outer membrane lipoprotein